MKAEQQYNKALVELHVKPDKKSAVDLPGWKIDTCYPFFLYVWYGPSLVFSPGTMAAVECWTATVCQRVPPIPMGYTFQHSYDKIQTNKVQQELISGKCEKPNQPIIARHITEPETCITTDRLVNGK
ncbi:hypothetical protein OUZ56_004883 [Daphnia magna]|uniref:Uncharacterized protein n=1 Tax=Daphnia magna TaxID=35525 RepID=A0ABQ9YRD8_9CRUS|nr:hypothetical protein OUZ56_004883 [Daphnia magna]